MTEKKSSASLAVSLDMSAVSLIPRCKHERETDAKAMEACVFYCVKDLSVLL